ncbi:hypothetical protein SESBI_14218 [Sesbania bispinosa]|nr:hypothetical protein SESBI_14218 [Sesbania bispinosa]
MTEAKNLNAAGINTTTNGQRCFPKNETSNYTKGSSTNREILSRNVLNRWLVINLDRKSTTHVTWSIYTPKTSRRTVNKAFKIVLCVHLESPKISA